MSTEKSNTTETAMTADPLLVAVVCDKCGKEFKPYKWSEECGSCHGDGEYEYEMEWEYEPTMHRCPFCKGHGEFTWEEKKTCRSCKEYSLYEDDDDDDEYYCDKCGRDCNCH